MVGFVVHAASRRLEICGVIGGCAVPALAADTAHRVTGGGIVPGA